MTFAQIPKEAILHLKGLRFHLFAIVQMEMFESGEGVCKLTPKELAEKYPVLGNYDSLCRYRKALIKDGWLLEAVGGIITKSFNNTDILSVETEIQTDEISVIGENTDEISVEQEKPLIKYQSDTGEISGTGIALNRNLDLEDNLNTHTKNAQARATEQIPDFQKFPLKELFDHFPNFDFKPGTLGFYESAVKEVDKAAWLSTLKLYKLNFDPEKDRYMPDKAGNVLSVFETEKAKLKKANRSKNDAKPTTHQNRTNTGEQHQSGAPSSSDEVRRRLRARRPTHV